MPSLVQRVSLLLLFLLAFDASSFVLGSPQPPSRQLSQRLVNGETNAKRFAMGLPPLPPMRRASGTEFAKRTVPSGITTFQGAIKVTSAVDHSTIGFLQLSGDQSRYIVGPGSSGDQFAATFNPGTTATAVRDINGPASHPFLAGLISPGVELLASNSNAAIVGGAAVITSSGATPQSGGSVSIPGDEYETTIWNIALSPPTMTASWVNHAGSQPPISIVWDPVGQTLYLTANPTAVILNHPGSQTVELSPVA